MHVGWRAAQTQLARSAVVKDGASAPTYNPVVRFTTADGRTVEFTSALGYGRKPNIGEALDVRYLPDHPERAEIDRAAMWMLPTAVGVLSGLGLVVAGAVVFAG